MTTHLSKIHMKNNDWKERLNVVYSTNPDFNYEHGEEEETATPDKKQQKLRVSISQSCDHDNRLPLSHVRPGQCQESLVFYLLYSYYIYLLYVLLQ